MPVFVSDLIPYKGTVTPSDLNVETTVVEVSGLGVPFIVEGYIDLSQLQEGDVVEVREYISVDGTNYRLFLKSSFSGVQESPIIRFHSKTFTDDMKYKVTIIQTQGAIRSFPYRFIVEKLSTG